MSVCQLGSALLTWAALVLLSRRTEERHLGLAPLTPGRRRLHAIVGWGLLLSSLPPLIRAEGASFGAVLWTSQTGLLALLLACALPFAVRTVMASAWLAAAAGSVLIAVACPL